MRVRYLFFPGTYLADTSKLDVVPPRVEPGSSPHAQVQRLVHRKVKIDDRPADIADEVIMMLCIGVEPIECAAEVDPGNKPLFGQHGEVAVHGTHAQVGETPSQPGV